MSFALSIKCRIQDGSILFLVFSLALGDESPAGSSLLMTASCEGSILRELLDFGRIGMASFGTGGGGGARPSAQDFDFFSCGLRRSSSSISSAAVGVAFTEAVLNRLTMAVGNMPFPSKSMDPGCIP
eukprot:CAMPEP_0181488078 /NCGR_PEP_ID=MMETSP1110-20121109/48189_1 /TAXON_ID=174948 /ORGANISM="Symbiodinium sp., Strain CCMP421" /LENGTH=126 /DNA_ID=CAMNT_0023614685 /DNA_START=394 /DNA_END=770 /DNA_ORIENTATION=+